MIREGQPEIRFLILQWLTSDVARFACCMSGCMHYSLRPTLACRVHVLSTRQLQGPTEGCQVLSEMCRSNEGKQEGLKPLCVLHSGCCCHMLTA